MSTATITTSHRTAAFRPAQVAEQAMPSTDGLFVVASAPAGWYEVADGFRRRWFDGRSWTDHYAPILALVEIDPEPVRTHFRTGHGFHAIMTVMTLGIWIPVWGTVTVCNAIRSTAPAPMEFVAA